MRAWALVLVCYVMFIAWFVDWSREVYAKDLPILTAGTSSLAAGLMVVMLFVKLCFSRLFHC